MTTEQAFEMELRVRQRWRERAEADLQTVQQRHQGAPEQPTLFGGMDYARRWR
jgi:hypothetical protein